MISTDRLARIALDLQLGISHQDRFHRLIQSVRSLLHSDASALLRYEGGQFIPLAIDGLMQDVLGRRFALRDHPRMEAIARAGDVVRFPADSSLPDPYDGLLPDHDDFKVHACVGLPLFSDQALIGALTIDGMNPTQFDAISDEELRLVGALAAAALNNALLLERLARQSSEPLVPGTRPGPEQPEMIGQSPAMARLRHEIDVVANSELNVLILGETGVGKELIAKAVHRGSQRAKAPLVYLNCAALPESVAESELFGHVKGAFTGAIHNRAGKFELADQGTLFLDEIGELSLPLQAKLLRVLQYGDLQRIGDDTPLKVNVRILAATNRDLKQAVVEGQFRADLYHRLSVFPIHAPALRERPGDIPLLAGYFCERCRLSLGLERLRIQPQALQLLERHDWPGNVRELEHAIHRAAVLARAEQGSQAPTLASHHFNLAAGPLPPST
ncbi:nitric oxide reductase transcriptional regulator NorR, partial [Aeromonas media]|uniref:nitric oxide reductase transcriptional regulator NorR n=1 Tax=Aeromonas media TaxID=651 RepID=UPI003D01E810